MKNVPTGEYKYKNSPPPTSPKPVSMVFILNVISGIMVELGNCHSYILLSSGKSYVIK